MSTHYMAGGMPLAFTQEDFLVLTNTTILKIDLKENSIFMSHRTRIRFFFQQQVSGTLGSYCFDPRDLLSS